MTEQQKSQQKTQPNPGGEADRLPVLTPDDPLPETMQKEFDGGKGAEEDE